MYKIIGGDQKEYGPATPEEMRQWVEEGRLSGQSLVQADGGPWKPLATFPEFAAALQAQVTHMPSAPAPTPAPVVSAQDWSEQILSRQPTLRVGYCLGRAWELIWSNLGLLCGATCVIWLISMICLFLPMGSAFYWVLSGVFDGGLYLVFLRRIRGREVAIGDVFAGFSIAYSQLMLAGVVSSLLTGIGLLFCIVPWIFLQVAWTFSVPLVADKGLEFWSAMELSRKVVARVWFQALALVVVAFLPYIVAYLIVQIKIGMAMFPHYQSLMGSAPPDLQQFMNTMIEAAKASAEVAKANIPSILLTKCVLLVNLPFATAALMYAYEDLFGSRTTPRA